MNELQKEISFSAGFSFKKLIEVRLEFKKVTPHFRDSSKDNSLLTLS